MRAWGQEEVTLTSSGECVWTFTLPNTDVEIKVEYFTDEELFTAGVPLRQTGEGEWVLDIMPNFDVELEVVYFTDEVCSRKRTSTTLWANI